jgi:hypothetical protein
MNVTRIHQSATPSPFEPGACVATGIPQLAGASLESDTDSLAAVEARRIEMIREWDGKINALKERAADLKEQASAKRAEVHKLAEANAGENYNRISALQSEASGLDEHARSILNVELPPLEFERTSIRGGSHPTIMNLHFRAEQRIAADRRAKEESKWTSFVAAQEAFDQHLAAIATPETFRLARTLADASAAQTYKRQVDHAVSTLLASQA